MFAEKIWLSKIISSQSNKRYFSRQWCGIRIQLYSDTIVYVFSSAIGSSENYEYFLDELSEILESRERNFTRGNSLPNNQSHILEL